MEIPKNIDSGRTGPGREVGSPGNVKMMADKILITDRDLLTLPVKNYFVTTLGAEIFFATHPVDILSILKHQRIDAIILDLTINYMQPFKIIDYIISNNCCKKVIIVYDKNTLEMAIEVLSKGSFNLIKKPYDVSQLADILLEEIDDGEPEDVSVIEYGKEKEDGTGDYSDKYHFMVENSQDVIYTMDNNGLFTFINSRVESLLGFKEDELIGKHFSVLVHHEDIEVANKLFYEQKNIDNMHNQYELRLKSRRGSCEPVTFDIRSTLIPNKLAAINGFGHDSKVSTDELLGAYCVARDVSERKRVEEIASQSAHHDYLTGLPDKILIKDRIDAAIAQSRRSTKKRFAVMFLDLDGFKDVNDTYGHNMGDEFLQAVSARIKGCIREVDTLARVGGDEFMLLVSHIVDRSDVDKIAEKILHEIQKPYNLLGCKLTLSSSIGIAMYPEDGETKEELISCADFAMYSVKRHNKNDYQFSPDA